MARIFRAPEPTRTTLPSGWEWRAYGARHLATGHCVSWSPNAGVYVADSTPGTYRTVGAAIAAMAL